MANNQKDKSAPKKTPLIAVYNEKPDLRKKEPPLVNLQVSNPVTYLKSWWKRVVGGEGIDFHFRIKPLTAIALTIIIATFGFGLGRFVFTMEKPYIKYIPSQSDSTSTPILERETAFSGTLQLSGSGKYYLLTATSEAVTLEVPENVNLSTLVSRRIFAAGLYNESLRTLKVSEASAMEVLPKKKEAVPTVASPSASSVSP